MRGLSRLIGFVAVAGLVFAGKFYHKSSAAGEVKQKLLDICQDDSRCVSAVDTHYDTCFESSYNLGGRRRSGRLNGEQLTNCINEQAGEAYFEYDPK